MKILVCDDDRDIVDAIAIYLKNEGYEPVKAYTGMEALAAVEAGGIALVIMDVMMPGMDGYETIRAIREIEQFRALPIIAVTAKAMKGDREKCIEAGASDYIPKPVDLDQLFSMLRVWLYRPEAAIAGA